MRSENEIEFMPKFVPYSKKLLYNKQLQLASEKHLQFMESRRTVRDFSSEPLNIEVIKNIVMSASTAPSGANKQPWTFCIVTNPDLKKQIRNEAEKEEYISYSGRMPQQWLDDLKYLGTNWQKPFLEDAPVLIIVFKRNYELINNEKINNYYVTESVGLACGFLLNAIHQCGLVALTHTPSPMNFLCTLLQRPKNETPFLLIPVGYPAKDVMVPDIQRKQQDNVIVEFV
jgi:iodotyrosine deiodinase